MPYRSSITARRTKTAAHHSCILARISESLNKKYSCRRSQVERPSVLSHHILASATKSFPHLFVHLDGVATPTGKQHTITRFNGGRHDLASLVRRSWAYGDDRRLWQRCVGRRRRKENSRRSFLTYANHDVSATPKLHLEEPEKRKR